MMAKSHQSAEGAHCTWNGPKIESACMRGTNEAETIMLSDARQITIGIVVHACERATAEMLALEPKSFIRSFVISIHYNRNRIYFDDCMIRFLFVNREQWTRTRHSFYNTERERTVWTKWKTETHERAKEKKVTTRCWWWWEEICASACMVKRLFIMISIFVSIKRRNITTVAKVAMTAFVIPLTQKHKRNYK